MRLHLLFASALVALGSLVCSNAAAQTVTNATGVGVAGLIPSVAGPLPAAPGAAILSAWACPQGTTLNPAPILTVEVIGIPGNYISAGGAVILATGFGSPLPVPGLPLPGLVGASYMPASAAPPDVRVMGPLTFTGPASGPLCGFGNPVSIIPAGVNASPLPSLNTDYASYLVLSLTSTGGLPVTMQAAFVNPNGLVYASNAISFAVL